MIPSNAACVRFHATMNPLCRVRVIHEDEQGLQLPENVGSKQTVAD